MKLVVIGSLFLNALPGYGAVVRLEVPELAAKAKRIIVGDVTEVTGFRHATGGEVRTRVVIHGCEYLSGEGTGTEVLEMPGGTVGDLTLRVSVLPVLQPGDHVLLFLDGEDGALRLVGGFQGAYLTDGRVVARMAPGSRGIVADSARTLTEMRRLIEAGLPSGTALPTPGPYEGPFVMPVGQAASADCYDLTDEQGQRHDWTYKAHPMDEDYVIRANCADPACGSPSSQILQIRNGASAWEAACADFHFSYGGTSSSCFANMDSPDGKNCVYFEQTWPLNDWPVAALAVAQCWWLSSAPRNIVECDVAFNDQYFLWWNGTGACPFDGHDIWSVAAHEFGHFLKLVDLYDSSCSDETMYGYGDSCETHARDIGSGDIKGMQSIYGGRCGDGQCEQACTENPCSCQADCSGCCDDDDCADGNPCTNDSCGDDGRCVNPPKPFGTPCGSPSDVNCDAPDSCDVSGACVDRVDPQGTLCRPTGGECDVAEVCNGSSKACPADGKKASGTPCTDDGNECTQDECDGNNVDCQHPAKPPGTQCTPDEWPCTHDECSADTCIHEFRPRGFVCRPSNSGDECDPAETCTGTSVECPDDYVEPDGRNCSDDGQGCTDDTCSSGTCAHELLPAGFVCRPSVSGDECDPEEACSGTFEECPDDYVAPDGTECLSNIDPCDGRELCAGGACRSAGDPCAPLLVCRDEGNDTYACVECLTGSDCDDKLPCTTDRCSDDGFCERTLNLESCLIDDACYGDGDRNPANICKRCDVSNPTAWTPTSGDRCDDGNACTTNDACSNGQCSGGPPLSCDDSNPCTSDSCSPSSGCAHLNNTNGCDDENACTTDDKCSTGTCVGGPSLNCDDANPCTTDLCDGATGCVHATNSDPCDDRNACTAGDICSQGACAGSSLNCDDGNTCTSDVCNPSSGCVHAYNADSCDDGNACTTNDRCSTGLCVGGPTLNCDDVDVCTDDYCDPRVGCVHSNNTASCADELYCNGVETCTGGVCTPGIPVNCDDGEPCTTDVCNESTDTCTHSPNDAFCDDGLYCTGLEVCDSQHGCQDGPDPECDDGVACTTDACDEDGDACVSTPDDAFCDDGQYCSGVETCDRTSDCQSGTPPSCSDGNSSNVDKCDAASDRCKHGGLVIEGADEIAIASNATYTCAIVFDDGSSEDATGLAEWRVVDADNPNVLSGCATISNTGVVTPRSHCPLVDVNVQARVPESSIDLVALRLVSILPAAGTEVEPGSRLPSLNGRRSCGACGAFDGLTSVLSLFLMLGLRGHVSRMRVKR